MEGPPHNFYLFYLLGHVPHFPDGYPADEILGVDLTASTGS